VKRASVALLLVFACASPPPVEQADARRREALLSADVEVLRELFADGLRYGHANGEVHAKEELLGLLGSGWLDYRAIRIEEIEARELSGVSVVTGRQTIEVRAAGRDVTSHSIFTAVYAREGRRWRLVAYQSTPLPISSEAIRSEETARPDAAPGR